jgi:hypothetical protein
MHIDELIPIIKKLRLNEGVEDKLLREKFKKNVGLIVTVAGIILQVLIGVFGKPGYSLW